MVHKTLSRAARRALFALVLAATCVSAARAQMGPRTLVNPGDAVTPQLLQDQGGPAGRELAPYIGKRPVLLVYWRPKEAASEQALVNAVAAAQVVAPEAVVLPIAALAANQPPSDIPERLAQMGLKHFPPREDTGQLALALGLRMVPAFVLIDAGGVLRGIGGSDITQNSATAGISLAEALTLASRGAPVPTLGVLASDPVYRMLGQKLPDAAVTELDGATYRKLSQYTGKDKRLLIFYWSPSCPHCKAELPRLMNWYRTKRPADLQLIDIARADAPELKTEAPQLVKDEPGTHLLDVDKSASLALRVRETPTVFLVGKAGEILGIKTGGNIDWDRWLSSPKK